MLSPLSLTSFLLILGLSNAWLFPSFFNDDLTSNNNTTTGLSMLDDFAKHMMAIHQRFEKLLSLSSFSTGHDVQSKEEWKQLDNVTPNCTTTTQSPSTSLEKARRKKLRNTQTITCVKELVIDGKQYIYKETNTTDSQGVLLSQTKAYQSFFIKTSNSTTVPTIATEELIKY